MPIAVIKGDLFEQNCDALVITSQPSLSLNGPMGRELIEQYGPDGPKIQQKIKKLKPIKFGEATMLDDDMMHRKIILVATPKWNIETVSKNNKAIELLHNCYTNALKKAVEAGLKSIAFPLLSSGVYKFPKVKAAEEALAAIESFKDKDKLNIGLVIKHESTFKDCRKTFKDAGVKIIGGHLTTRSEEFVRWTMRELGGLSWYQKDAEAILEEVDEKKNELATMDFKKLLKAYMVRTGLTPADCYRGIVSRAAFEKFYYGDGCPRKYTAVAIGINMHLDNDSIATLIGEDLKNGDPKDEIIWMGIDAKEDVKTINAALKSQGFDPLPTHPVKNKN